VNIGKQKKRAFRKGLMPFREIFMAFESWETHEGLSLYEQLG